MGQRIGNVGVLNLTNATPESIKDIEHIENVGMILYKKETAHLLSALAFGNIGTSVEVPDDYVVFSGVLKIDYAYLQAISTSPYRVMVNGVVIFAQDVQLEQLKQEFLQLMVNGKVYAPRPLSGAVSSILTSSKGAVVSYDHLPPRIENGVFTVNNALLHSFEEIQNFVVNGVLSLEKDLDMELFDKKIGKIEINGVITLYQEQETVLYKKVPTLATCKLEIIPSGYELVKNMLRVNSRSIRRFTGKKILMKKPLLIEADVTRELFEKTIIDIHSSSIIVCPEQLEDLIYERCSNLDVEVLAYAQKFHFIAGEETWSNEQLLALEQPLHFIVNGKLILEEDVEEGVLLEKLAAIDILGEVMVADKRLKGSLQKRIRVCTGTVVETTRREEGDRVLKNVGELTL